MLFRWCRFPIYTSVPKRSWKFSVRTEKKNFEDKMPLSIKNRYITAAFNKRSLKVRLKKRLNQLSTSCITLVECVIHPSHNFPKFVWAVNWRKFDSTTSVTMIIIKILLIQQIGLELFSHQYHWSQTVQCRNSQAARRVTTPLNESQVNITAPKRNYNTLRSRKKLKHIFQDLILTNQRSELRGKEWSSVEKK